MTADRTMFQESVAEKENREVKNDITKHRLYAKASTAISNHGAVESLIHYMEIIDKLSQEKAKYSADVSTAETQVRNLNVELTKLKRQLVELQSK